jgi:hypothetical protein
MSVLRRKISAAQWAFGKGAERRATRHIRTRFDGSDGGTHIML